MKNVDCVTSTNMDLPGLKKHYVGKVRDVYFLEDDIVAMIASDRISAFDHVLDRGIPYKGQVLNQIASFFLDATSDIVPNWKLASPYPNLSIGYECDPYRVEMVIRGYLTGHAWREYQSGKRSICGVDMPEGMRENDPFPSPIITPATKADEGHDEDISREEIIAQGVIPEQEYIQLENYTRALFKRGTEMAADNGLILVDTKYEFGKRGSDIYLIDEIHTPDSSRYFYADTYQQMQDESKPQRQLSKEFVREWLMSKGFQGKEGQVMPKMDDEFVELVSQRYIELYELITAQAFVRQEVREDEIRESIMRWLRGRE